MDKKLGIFYKKISCKAHYNNQEIIGSKLDLNIVWHQDFKMAV